MTENPMDERGTNDRHQDEGMPREQDRPAAGTQLLVPLMRHLHAGGDQAQSDLTMIIRHVEPVIRAFIGRRAVTSGRDEAFVDDVVQDALTLVVARVRQCRASTDREVMAWMLAVARSALAETVRREGPPLVSADDERFDSEVPLSFDESIGRRPSASPGLEIMLRIVVDASDALSADDATLLWMRLVADEEWASIGAALGTTATAARRRYQRAQQAMRRRVRDALRMLAPESQRLARDWFRKHLNETLDAHDDPMADDPRD